MKPENEMTLTFPSKSANESFARAAVACFAAQLDPNLEELNDIKTAVSEAVTNCIVHAYRGRGGEIRLSASYEKQRFIVRIEDDGEGIPDVEQAMKPFYTTNAEGERSGMGFTVMRAFTDVLTVTSRPGEGTTVVMEKSIGGSVDAE